MSNIVKCWWSSREKGSPCFNMVDSECPACQCEMHIRDDLCCGNDDDVYKLSRWSVVALLKQTVMFLRLCDSNHYYNCTVVLWSAELQLFMKSYQTYQLDELELRLLWSCTIKHAYELLFQLMTSYTLFW